MAKAMKRAAYHEMNEVARSKGLADGVIRGLASLLAISAPPHPSRFKAKSPETALKGDFVRIGKDMRTVASKAFGDEEATR